MAAAPKAKPPTKSLRLIPWLLILPPRPDLLKSFCLFEKAFHSRPALPGGFFGSAGAAPVRFQADAHMVSIAQECPELPLPIDGTPAHGRPLITLAVRLFHRVFAVAVPQPVFRQQPITVWIGRLAALERISG